MHTSHSVLTRGVETVLPSVDGLQKLMDAKKIRLYLGIDPTGNQLHLGHAVVLRKLQQFVELGHEVILLIGNGTVKIGDPTGKDKTRPMLTDEEIDQNFATWKEQASKILDFSRITIKKNGDWLDPLRFADLVKLMATTTVQQLLERDMFQERMKNNLPIFAHELIYPLMQGFDSVAMDVDLEIGGNDQLFNMMVGRQLQKQLNNREKFVMSVPLLVGSDGRKMGKSLNNFISLTATAEDMYGKLMSVVDEVVPVYFELLTDTPLEMIEKRKQQVAEGELHPMDFKKEMAFAVTNSIHGSDATHVAQEAFERTIQHKELPSNLPVLHVEENATVLSAVIASGSCASTGEARRLIEQGGVEVDGVKVLDGLTKLSIPCVLKVGKRNYFRVE